PYSYYEQHPPWGGRKGTIYLATPTVASGITLDDIHLVIDSAVFRIPSPYSISGLDKLELQWIDKKMLLQRAGRAGRTVDGKYRLCASRQLAKDII
ncbi:hypothetical protein PFISCL1PPCAC_21711, partial [Pristionchus fissidentatus]